jgi:hypothetical protein
VYVALGSPGLFALGNRADASACLVERSVNAAMNTALQEAEALLIARFSAVTLAELSADFHARLVERGITLDSESIHEV